MGASRPRRVLIVDDDPDLTEALRETLRDECEDECEVEAAAGGAEALEAIARNRPDLILLDLMMPVMNGIEVVERLCDSPETRRIPVAIHSHPRPAPLLQRVPAEFACAFFRAHALVSELAPLRHALRSTRKLEPERCRQLLRERAPSAAAVIIGRADEPDLLRQLSVRGGIEVVAARIYATERVDERALLDALRSARA